MRFPRVFLALFATFGVGFVGCDTPDSEPVIERDVNIEPLGSQIDPEADPEG